MPIREGKSIENFDGDQKDNNISEAKALDSERVNLISVQLIQPYQE